MFILYAALQGYRASMTSRLLLSGALLVGCGKTGEPVDELEMRSRMREAARVLTDIGNAAKGHHAETGTLPMGNVALTPAEACCTTEGPQCASSLKQWDHPLWNALHVKMYEAHWFRYAYASSDGKTAVAKAVGDLDCDGVAITFRLEIAITASGEVETALVAPSWKDD